MSNQIITTLIDGGNIIGKVSGFTYSSVQAELETKADKDYVDGQDALKADKTYTDAQLAEKATKTEVGLLSGLLTTAKTSIVAAINELFNSKANKAQEDWITPTLLNGWTQAQPVGYYKDSLGVVHLKGIIKSGTIGEDAFVLPVGYRPTNNYNNFAVKSTTVVGGLSIRGAALGTVRPANGSATEFCLDGVAFRAAEA